MALTVVILLLLDCPWECSSNAAKHDALTSTARRDATVLGAVAADSLEHPGEHDLRALAGRYKAETGAEVVAVNSAGQRLCPSIPETQPAPGSGAAATGALPGDETPGQPMVSEVVRAPVVVAKEAGTG